MGVSYRPMTSELVLTGSDRITLVRRTYMLVLASVFVTMGGVWFAMGQPAVMQWVSQHPIITMLGMFAPLMGALKFREVFPTNIGLVFLFAFVEGVMIAPLIAVLESRQPGIVGQAGLLTGSTFGVLTLYAFVSRRDFSAWGGFFTIGLWVLIATSLLNMFFRNATASLWLAGGTVLVFSGLLVFDTWRLRNKFGPNDYVQAAVAIYLDLLNMFLAILTLLGGNRRN